MSQAYAATESQDIQLGEQGAMGGINQDDDENEDALHQQRVSEASQGMFRIKLNIKQRLFLFSFDLIELNTFYNYVIYSLFLLVDFVFISYYPLNQIYSEFIVVNLPTAASNQTFNGISENVYSGISNRYQNIKGTGLYSETIVYDKRIKEENRDTTVPQALSYLNIDFFLDNMTFDEFRNVQSIFCHVFIIFYALFLVMIITR